MSEYILTADGELYHYGIKGMKWGVRRGTPPGALGGPYEENRRMSDRLLPNHKLPSRPVKGKVGKIIERAKKVNDILSQPSYANNSRKVMNKKLSDLDTSEFKDLKKTLEKILDPTKEHRNENFSEKPSDRRPFDEKPTYNKNGRI